MIKNVALLFMLPVLAMAETASHEMSIVTGRGELLQFGNDVTQVAASEPKIADVVVISPREVMINGKGPGRATVVIWETGSVPARYNIDVLADNFEFDQFRKQLRADFPGSNIEVTGKGDTIVLSGTVANLEQSKQAAGLASSRSKNVVNLLQSPPLPDARQILLQVKFASIDRTALTEIGFNLFSRNPKFLGELTTEQFQSPRFSQLQFQNQDFSNSTVNFADLLNLFAFRPDLNIGATIKALQDRNLLQILAEPNLITLEGKEASFLAGGSFPFPVLTTTSTGGSTSPVVTVQFKPFGVQLTFTPTVTNSGAIQLKVAPEVSSLDFANAVTLQGFLIPAISQRRAETEVILKDGESFAIAGLMDNRVLQDINQIPWLGSIPILGNLFRSRSTRKTSDELLVVITPHFVSPLTADEKAKMPDFEQTFLPTIADEKAKKAGKGKHKDDTAKPEFIGPRGHQEPN
ncbi:MAG: pilus assembly protein N-terminal domain-containing protein [Acidobacteriota bacterium]|nr:pilus assembly protein N-terminal domain-containing protein [Acidobacteriota bacterium]